MRILFVHERFGALAGAEANAFITASEFKQRGHAVGIIHGVPTGKNETAWGQTFEHRFSLAKHNNRALVQEALKAFQPDIVYVHKMADLSVIEALIDSGLPLVRMVHDHDIYCMRSYRYSYFTRKICTKPAGLHCVFPCGASVQRNHDGGFPLKLVSYKEKLREIQLNQKFNRMVVVTTFMREELIRNGFNPAVIEIHAPTPRMAASNLRSNFGDRNLIIYAGQIIRGKGVDVLLQSLKLLKNNFECIILGDGSHRAYCEKLSRKLGLADRVRFPGFVPQEELKDYYRECTVFAISSVWPEPFATVGIEVMRYGIPVVAFDVGGIRDWLHDGYNGFLVPWMDRQQYAGKLDQLLSDKHLAQKLGENGRQLVDQQYDFNRYIGDLEEMFARVISEHEVPGLPTLANASGKAAA